MEKFFKLEENGTNVRLEISSGITTFLAMVYILAVNPSILSAAGMDAGSVFTATCVSAAIGCFCMAFMANYPVALASGMGLNAYFAYTVVPNLVESGVQNAWQIALTAVLVEGIVFILLSATNFREMLVNDIPANLKHAITAGIGLFITIIGLKNAGIVVGTKDSTLIGFGDLATPQVALAIIGILIVAVLYHYNVRGYILIGILVTWVLGMIAQLTGWYVVDVKDGVYSLFPSFSSENFLPADKNIFAFDFAWAGSHLLDFTVVVFSFLFVDIFDTVGTLIGVASKGNLLDENGNLPNAKGALLSDAIATVVGACLGTSTVTSYVESTAGVANGGRTGLTAVTTGILFLISLFLSPIFLAIPSFATTPALVWVGLLMLSSIKEVDFSGDTADAVGAFMAIIMMPFTSSIANGIMWGMLTWVLLKVFTKKAKDVRPIMWVVFVLFAAYALKLIFLPTM
ncbi:MAG: NCS2 family permease [Anaerovoracaceae bacterium]|jgi:AGZA family xanthine/uracil permease-like MFS transporter